MVAIKPQYTQLVFQKSAAKLVLFFDICKKKCKLHRFFDFLEPSNGKKHSKKVYLWFHKT